ncbi:hypothetical protein BC828DRAFT_372018 [Blastocladiella britannica]|nr:hypothetical protein BC828DRAFT_372018 [Blastocladiella britannica]
MFTSSTPFSTTHPSSALVSTSATSRKLIVPVIGSTQQGKSTLIKFLHEYAEQPFDAESLLIGNGLSSTTRHAQRYQLNMPRRKVMLAAAARKAAAVSAAAAATGMCGRTAADSIYNGASSSSYSGIRRHAADMIDETMAEAEAIKIARDALAMDLADANASGRAADVRSLQDLLADLDLDLAAQSSNIDVNAADYTLRRETAEAERLEAIEDALEDRNLEMSLRTEAAAERDVADAMLTLELIDTPGLLDDAMLANPLADFDHLAATLAEIRQYGNPSALIYVVNANRPYDAASLMALRSYLTPLSTLTKNLIVVHSGYDFRSALRQLPRSRLSSSLRNSPLNLFDLGPRATEFDRLLATTLGFPQMRAIHVPMDNIVNMGARAGIRALGYEAVGHLMDVLEQLTVSSVSAVDSILSYNSATIGGRIQQQQQQQQQMFLKNQMLEAELFESKLINPLLVKPTAVREIDVLLESVLAKKMAAVRSMTNISGMSEIVPSASAIALKAQLDQIEDALLRLDSEELVEFAAVPARTRIVDDFEFAAEELALRSASALYGGVRSAEALRRIRKHEALRRHQLRRAATLLSFDVQDAAFPIRGVREVLPTGIPLAIRRRIVLPSAFVMEAAIPSVLFAGATPLAKLMTGRRDLYAREITALHARRAVLAAEMAALTPCRRRPELALGWSRMGAADLAGAHRELLALERAANLIRDESIPLEVALATRGAYGRLARAMHHQRRVAVAPMFVQHHQYVSSRWNVPEQQLFLDGGLAGIAEELIESIAKYAIRM